MADSVRLIYELHNNLLRKMSEAAGIHFTGLQQAGRHFGSALSTSQRRRVANVDIAFNVLRHITAPYSAGFESEILAATMSSGIESDASTRLDGRLQQNGGSDAVSQVDVDSGVLKEESRSHPCSGSPYPKFSK